MSARALNKEKKTLSGKGGRGLEKKKPFSGRVLETKNLYQGGEGGLGKLENLVTEGSGNEVGIDYWKSADALWGRSQNLKQTKGYITSF